MKSLLVRADALSIPLADASVQCVVTSPPYWGQRNYGVPGQLGQEALHDCGAWIRNTGKVIGFQEVDDWDEDETSDGERVFDFKGHKISPIYEPASGCGVCYVCRMRQVFGEVNRVMRNDGTLFLNLGDSYNGSGGAGGDYNDGGIRAGQPKYPGRRASGLKLKDLSGIPWRVALALQADGWYLRSEIIWNKKSAMPESVTDRPTRAHEHIFLLTKSERYFYDHYAVREPGQEWAGQAGTFSRQHGKMTNLSVPGQAHASHRSDREDRVPPGRNQRDVWTLGPDPFPGAHFATFVREIPRRAILSGTSERGCCPTCGAPWRRVIEKGYRAASDEDMIATMIANGVPRQKANLYRNSNQAPFLYADNPDKIIGWRPSCSCYPRADEWREFVDQEDSLTDTDPNTATINQEIARLRKELLSVYSEYPTVSCIVFDPFNGSGTTGLVAESLGRRYIGTDLNQEYLRLAQERIGHSAWEAWETGRKIESTDLGPLFRMQPGPGEA